MTREECFARWLRYTREAEKANTFSYDLSKPMIPDVRAWAAPTVQMMRSDVLRFRQQYFSLLAIVGDLLEVDPEELSEGKVFFAMLNRYAPIREPEES